MAKPNHLSAALILVAGICFWGAVATTDVASAQTPPQTQAPGAARTPCAATTDEQIVAAIQEKIKADHRFDNQWGHINVSVRNRVVYLAGWVEGNIQFRDLIKYAHRTRCVRLVNTKFFKPSKWGGCGQGMKPCGDICIPREETCNLIQ